jgi:hypothetical protein
MACKCGERAEALLGKLGFVYGGCGGGTLEYVGRDFVTVYIDTDVVHRRHFRAALFALVVRVLFPQK